MADNTKQINPFTGFVEHPGEIVDFDSDRKLHFLEVFYQTGGKLYKTAEICNLSHHTVKKALNNDPVFKEKYDEVWDRLRDDIQANLTENALKRDDPRYQSSLIFWLKKNFPSRYADDLKIQNNSVVINIDSQALSNYEKKAAELSAIEAESFPSIDMKNEIVDLQED